MELSLFDSNTLFGSWFCVRTHFLLRIPLSCLPERGHARLILEKHTYGFKFCIHGLNDAGVRAAVRRLNVVYH